MFLFGCSAIIPSWLFQQFATILCRQRASFPCPPSLERESCFQEFLFRSATTFQASDARPNLRLEWRPAHETHPRFAIEDGRRRLQSWARLKQGGHRAKRL